VNALPFVERAIKLSSFRFPEEEVNWVVLAGPSPVVVEDPLAVPPIGAQYYPVNRFTGLFVPRELLGWREIPARAKLAFAVVAKAVGECGTADLQLDEIAVDLGVSRDSVRRDLRCLENAGLVRHRRTGRASEYSCTWHNRLAAGLRSSHSWMRELELGSPYSPWKKFVFVLIPVSLVDRTEISAEAKLLFGLLALYGRKGRCFPSDDTLARRMAISIPQLRRVRRELLRVGLIGYYPELTNDTYHFIFQQALLSSLRSLEAQTEEADDWANEAV
jgi:transcription initiation factor IIE alpha subunit